MEDDLLTTKHRRKIIDSLSPGQSAIDALLKAQAIKTSSKQAIYFTNTLIKLDLFIDRGMFQSARKLIKDTLPPNSL